MRSAKPASTKPFVGPLLARASITLVIAMILYPFIALLGLILRVEFFTWLLATVAGWTLTRRYHAASALGAARHAAESGRRKRSTKPSWRPVRGSSRGR